jgi:putative ABC transport system substrate-binding protein
MPNFGNRSNYRRFLFFVYKRIQIVVKRIFPLIALLLLFRVPSVTAGGLMVVQSLQIKPYNEALRGFKSACTGTTRVVASAEQSEANIVEKVRRHRPDLILAIGLDALAKVKNIRDVPIVYLMVMNPQSLVQDTGNIAGVSMNIQPERQLSIVRQVLPHARKIGLPFDPDKSGAFVRKLQAAAQASGIELVTRKVHNARETAAALDDFERGKIDALWLPPDTTVINPGTVDLLILTALENRIPVYTFSDKYVEKGALFCLEVDAAEAGRQAGELANRILAGTAVKNIENVDARGGILTVNLIVAKKLGIPINGDVIKKARKIQ